MYKQNKKNEKFRGDRRADRSGQWQHKFKVALEMTEIS